MTNKICLHVNINKVNIAWGQQMQSIVCYKYAIFHNFTGFVVTLKIHINLITLTLVIALL